MVVPIKALNGRKETIKSLEQLRYVLDSHLDPCFYRGDGIPHNSVSHAMQEAHEKIMLDCGCKIIERKLDGRVEIAHDPKRQIPLMTVLNGLRALVRHGTEIPLRRASSCHLRVHPWSADNLCNYIVELCLKLRHYPNTEVSGLISRRGRWWFIGGEIHRLHESISGFTTKIRRALDEIKQYTGAETEAEYYAWSDDGNDESDYDDEDEDGYDSWNEEEGADEYGDGTESGVQPGHPRTVPASVGPGVGGGVRAEPDSATASASTATE